MMSEDTAPFLSHLGNVSGPLDPVAARTELEALKFDSRFQNAYLDRTHIGHERAVKLNALLHEWAAAGDDEERAVADDIARLKTDPVAAAKAESLARVDKVDPGAAIAMAEIEKMQADPAFVRLLNDTTLPRHHRENALERWRRLNRRAAGYYDDPAVDNAQVEIKRLRDDKPFMKDYTNPNAPGHRAAVARMAELHAIAAAPLRNADRVGRAR